MYERLAEPFPVNKIHWRLGATNQEKTKGIALAYIDARDVMERLDEVVGPGNWQCEHPFPGCCRVGIKIDGEWVWKANGAGETDVEGKKGMFSDSFKRAAVLWGVGRYLYALPNEWVPIVQQGRSYAIQKGAEPKLPPWADPMGNIADPEIKLDHVKRFKELLEGDDNLALYCFSEWMGANKYTTLYNSFQTNKTAMKRKVDMMTEAGKKEFGKYVKQYQQHGDDELWIDQTRNEIGDAAFKMIEEAA